MTHQAPLAGVPGGLLGRRLPGDGAAPVQTVQGGAVVIGGAGQGGGGAAPWSESTPHAHVLQW